MKRQPISLGAKIVLIFVGMAAFFGAMLLNNDDFKSSQQNRIQSSDSNSSLIKQKSENVETQNIKNQPKLEDQPVVSGDLYDVLKVVDGDTIKVMYNGRETSVRFIGVNTPETVDPRKPVECFGREASDHLKNLLSGKKVKLRRDDTQTDRDKYGRILRYVYLDDQDVNLAIISNGYGYEYTYNGAFPYAKQAAYKQAQKDAETNKRGLWADSACAGQVAKPATPAAPVPPAVSAPQAAGNCEIKGNISARGEKIYHLPGQKYYNATRISEGKGERWFCSEAEAQAAGWRRSKV